MKKIFNHIKKSNNRAGGWRKAIANFREKKGVKSHGKAAFDPLSHECMQYNGQYKYSGFEYPPTADP